jgi:nucleotide-binding universal stress UspA family protein
MAALQLVPQITFKNILFTTDFSDYAERALPYAVGLARRYGATIYVAHAIRPEPRRPLPLEPLPRELDELRFQAAHAMHSFVNAAPLAGLHYEVVLARGETETVFQEMAIRHDIDLVVIATHGRAGVKKLLLGSVAEEIFRNVICPVLTVGPDVKRNEIAAGTLQDVLYACDFSPASLHALPYALALAANYGARLICVHVIEEITTLPQYYREQAMRDARQELEKLVPRNCGLAGEPQVIVATGQPAERILELARDLDAGLVVMGARHQGSLRIMSHLPWACAHQVLCHAGCPVLTARAGPQ